MERLLDSSHPSTQRRKHKDLTDPRLYESDALTDQDQKTIIVFDPKTLRPVDPETKLKACEPKILRPSNPPRPQTRRSSGPQTRRDESVLVSNCKGLILKFEGLHECRIADHGYICNGIVKLGAIAQFQEYFIEDLFILDAE